MQNIVATGLPGLLEKRKAKDKKRLQTFQALSQTLHHTEAWESNKALEKIGVTGLQGLAEYCGYRPARPWRPAKALHRPARPWQQPQASEAFNHTGLPGL